MKRKFLSALLVFTMLLAFITQPAQAREARLWVEGSYVTGDVSPIIHKNRTLVPLRQVAEALNLKVQWTNEAREARVEINGTTHAFIPGKAYYNAGDVKVEMDTETIIRNNRTYLPLRVIAEAMGKPVSWDQATSTAIVGTGFVAESTAQTPGQVQGQVQVQKTVVKTPAPGAPQGKGHIRGNRMSRIYHLPGGASYDKIAPRNIVRFESEAQAQAAGYRRAKR